MPDICTGYPTKVLMAPNLGLSSLAGNLDKKHNVKIADLVLHRKNIKKAVEESLEKTRPDLVGLSAMTFQYKTALRIATFIKKLNPAIKTALGGYHASLMFREIANSKDAPCFDFLFRGESDLSFNEAANRLENGRDLKAVDGLSFKRNGKFIHNRKRKLEDLDQIELPDRSVRLWNCFNVLKVPFDLIEFSRGCLMSCNFCNIRSMYGRSFRTYRMNRVMRDIESAKKLGIKILFFVDDNITIDVKRFEHLCDEIIKNGHDDLLYAIQASSVGIASSERLANKMARAGFKLVFLGIENPYKQNLMNLNKGNIVEKSILAVKYLKENGILISGGFIIGNPDDDYQSIHDTYKFAKTLKVDFGAIQILVPYPKTKMRDNLLESGLLVNRENYEKYDGSYANIKTKHLSDRQLNFIKYILSKKYFNTREFNILKIILKNKRKSMRFFKGGISLIPVVLDFFIITRIKRLFLSEQKVFFQHLQKVSKLNEFNI